MRDPLSPWAVPSGGCAPPGVFRNFYTKCSQLTNSSWGKKMNSPKMDPSSPFTHDRSSVKNRGLVWLAKCFAATWCPFHSHAPPIVIVVRIVGWA